MLRTTTITTVVTAVTTAVTTTIFFDGEYGDSTVVCDESEAARPRFGLRGSLIAQWSRDR